MALTLDPDCQTCKPPCPAAKQGESSLSKGATAAMSHIWRRSRRRDGNMPSWRRHCSYINTTRPPWSTFLAPLGDTLCRLGIQRSVANKLWNKIYEHTIACADKLMKSRRMLERSKCRQNRKRPRADPPRSMTKVNPSELLPWDSSLGGASRSRGSHYDASRCKLPLVFFCIARAVKTGQQAR